MHHTLNCVLALSDYPDQMLLFTPARYRILHWHYREEPRLLSPK